MGQGDPSMTLPSIDSKILSPSEPKEVARKEKRWNQKKDLNTTHRKQNKSNFVLSPEQIKFNQNNLLQMFDQEETSLKHQIANKRHQANNSTNPALHYRKKTLHDQDLQGVSFTRKNKENFLEQNLEQLERGFNLTAVGNVELPTSLADEIPLAAKNRIQPSQNSYLSNSNVGVKTATHKRRNISIGADRTGLDTA